MSRTGSEFYPPRARWYSPALTALGNLWRELRLDRIKVPQGFPFWPFVAGSIVPGLAIWFRGPRIFGLAAMAASLLLSACFIVWLGFPGGNLAFGLLLGLHCTGLVYLAGPWLARMSFRYRLGFTLAVLMMLGGLVYSPVRGAVQKHWFLPLRVPGNVIVVRPDNSVEGLRHHDWLAYRYEGSRGTGFYVRGGISLGPIIALPGDRVRFTAQHVLVNGVPEPRMPHMPDTGEFVMPQKQWLVWPEFAITTGDQRVGEATLAGTMLQVGTITQEQIVGRPMKKWLWRRQLSS